MKNARSFAELEKLQRSDVQLSENGVSPHPRGKWFKIGEGALMGPPLCQETLLGDRHFFFFLQYGV